MFSEFFSREFFRGYSAVYAQIFIAAAASAAFAIILPVHIIFPKSRAFLKKFFVGVAAFSCFFEMAICLSGLFFSGKAEVFTGLAVFSGSVAVFFAQCGILSLFVSDERHGIRPCFSENPAEAKVAREASLSGENPVKREKKAAIYEIPLRKTQVVRMEKPVAGEEVLGVNYLMQCIDILKGKELSDSDALKLSAAEKLVKDPAVRDFGYRRRISDGCGKIITLLAKYK